MASKIEEIIVWNHDDADEVSPVSETTEERRFRWVKSIDARLEDNYSMVLSTAALPDTKPKQTKATIYFTPFLVSVWILFCLSSSEMNRSELVKTETEVWKRNSISGTGRTFFFFPSLLPLHTLLISAFFFQISNSSNCVKPIKGNVIIARTRNGVKE